MLSISVVPLFRSNAAPSTQQLPKQFSNATTSNGPKILYIVTSISEFDDGRRNTRKGRDRYRETLIPVVSEAVDSMLSLGYQVDVYLISHYEIYPERRALLRQNLPANVRLEVWDDATPFGYSLPSDTNYENTGTICIQPITRALSRQHRYVIKDKLLYYDLFVNFEDDMLIKGDHIQHYLEMTNEIRRLKDTSPSRLLSNGNPMDRFHGPLTKMQVARLLPGFIRVEVISDKEDFQKDRQQHALSLPIHPNAYAHYLNATPCCRRNQNFVPSNGMKLSFGRLTHPTMDDNIYLWETQAIALGLHKMPNGSSLDWVVLQRGIDQTYIQRGQKIGEYWVGQDLEENVERPNPTAPQYINNQGGWMATPQQIWAWHTGHCKNQLLPPYDDLDGLKNNVEFWSGGLSLVGMNACQLQRIISLKPKDFARHIIYHTSNNKQKSKHLTFTNVGVFWRQLYTAQMVAETTIT